MNEVLWLQSSSGLLEDIYKATSKSFDPSRWKNVSEVCLRAWDANVEDSLCQRVREAITCNETIMFVPAPENGDSYRVFRLDWEDMPSNNDAMMVIGEWIPAEQVIEALSLNLTRKRRDIVILSPNVRGTTADLYVIEKWSSNRWMTQTISTQNKVWEILSDKVA